MGTAEMIYADMKWWPRRRLKNNIKRLKKMFVGHDLGLCYCYNRPALQITKQMFEKYIGKEYWNITFIYVLEDGTFDQRDDKLEKEFIKSSKTTVIE